MKKTLLAVLAISLVAACSKPSQPASQAADNSAEPREAKEVVGRVNFDAAHPVITPLPCLMIATYDKDQVPNVMMAAWGGQCGPNRITFELSAHKTTENLRLKKAFTVSFATADDVAQSDYFGTVSGTDVPNKLERAGFTATPSPNVDAPIIDQYKLTLECQVVEMNDDDKGGACVVGEVVNWSADPSIVRPDGKIDLAKLRPIMFDSSTNTYRVVADSVGKAWGSGQQFMQ